LTNGTGQLLQGQILAQLRLETCGVMPWARKAASYRSVENLPSTLKASTPAIVWRTVVTGEHAVLARLDQQQALVDQVIEDCHPRFRVVQHLGIELGAKLGTQALLLLAQGLLELLLGNLQLANGSHIATSPGIAHVGIDAEKGERQGNQREKTWTIRLLLRTASNMSRKSFGCVQKGKNAWPKKGAIIP
jgi:hypothetical protein